MLKAGTPITFSNMDVHRMMLGHTASLEAETLELTEREERRLDNERSEEMLVREHKTNVHCDDYS